MSKKILRNLLRHGPRTAVEEQIGDQFAQAYPLLVPDNTVFWPLHRGCHGNLRTGIVSFGQSSFGCHGNLRTVFVPAYCVVVGSCAYLLHPHNEWIPLFPASHWAASHWAAHSSLAGDAGPRPILVHEGCLV